MLGKPCAHGVSDDVRAPGYTGSLGQSIVELSRSERPSVVRNDVPAISSPGRHLRGERGGHRNCGPSLLSLSPPLRIQPNTTQAQINLILLELPKCGFAQGRAHRKDEEPFPALTDQ